MNNNMHSLEKQLEDKRTARLEAEKNAESRIHELKDSLRKTQRETEELIGMCLFYKLFALFWKN